MCVKMNIFRFYVLLAGRVKMSFGEYASIPEIKLEPEQLPDNIDVILKWVVPFGKYKGQQYGYVVTHDADWLRKLMGWKKLDTRTSTLIQRVLDAYDAWTGSVDKEDEPVIPLVPYT